VTRRGSLLIEVLVALAIAAGPLLIAVNVIHSSMRGARFNTERTSARLALMDVVALLLGAPVESLRQLGRADSAPWLDTLLQERISHLPDDARQQYDQEVAPFLGRFTCTFEEKIDPRAPGLARLTLSVKIGDQATVSIVRLFRPDDRETPD
jgi:hypothetical protein